MSLYNMMCGNNPLYGLYLAVLSSETPLPDIPRFRDAFVSVSPADSGTIVIYTRTGGGNREDYGDENEALTKHPLYIRDYDDDFDSTFAYWVFQIPDKFHGKLVELQKRLDGLHKFQPPRDKFARSMSALNGAAPEERQLSEKESEEIGEMIADLCVEVGLLEREASA